MEARVVCRVGCLITALLMATVTADAADVVTTNFTVRAPSRQLARKVGELAEQYRKDLAIRWTGQEFPAWPNRCPITVEIAQHAGGETSFIFMPDRTGRSAPSHWQMKVFGPPERILDSVLPHEVSHTIFATHFGRPLPRWADEGACTTVEHESERRRNNRMLIEFLQTKRGIPFNHMFSMKQYPDDILPLYAQGHSLARYLIMQKGERHFVDYIGAGMDRERPGRIPQTWNQVTQEFYGFENLSDLQVTWLKWVSDGSPNLERQDIAQSQTDASEIKLVSFENQNQQATGAMQANNIQPYQNAPTQEQWRTMNQDHSLQSMPQNPDRYASSEDWYMQQMRSGHTKDIREQSFVQHNRTEPANSGLNRFQPGSIAAALPLDRLTASLPITTASPPRAFHGTVERNTIWR